MDPLITEKEIEDQRMVYSWAPSKQVSELG